MEANIPRASICFAQDLEGEHDLSNMYIFPPFSLIGPVLRFVIQCRRTFTIVVPGGHPRGVLVAKVDGHVL